MTISRARVGLMVVASAVLLPGRVGERADGPPPVSARGFDLLAQASAALRANRALCGVTDVGRVCADPQGIWPGGTNDRYIYTSGLQVAGIIPTTAGFAWAGDTVGAFFIDGRGTQEHGQALTPIVDSRALQDLVRWPTSAWVRSGVPFDPALTGRRLVSEQDIWVRFWDGDPTRLSGRRHPVGMAVDLRAMAWGSPVGNDDIIYFVYDLYNVSASDPAAYAGLEPALRADLADVGRRFQEGVATELGVAIPDAGYRLDSLFAALYMDPDIEDASRNYSTVAFSFDATAAYKHDFTAPTWVFPSGIFSPPFTRAPGFVGAAFLATPDGAPPSAAPRIAIFSNFSGSSTGFPDPVGVVQLWRYLSGRLSSSAGDNPCTVRDPIANRFCYLRLFDSDTRFIQSTGPFSLAPGERATLVMAYVFSAPVASIQPGVITNPGIPPAADSLVLGTDTLRTVDRAMGWLAHADLDGNGRITAAEVTTVPRSFLHKVQIAQAVVNAGFRLAGPPAPPRFFVVAGDRRATIVWEPSVTERLGDAYYAVASDPASPLFDPNYRQFDVEGYRIYRGRTPNRLELIAQFDYDGTTFVDRTGALDTGDCAPELGVTRQCPVAFDYPYTATGPTREVDLAGALVQVRPGDRIALPDGAVEVLRADTAVIGGGARVPGLTNTRVPFAFNDEHLANAVPYYYAVTAFDVNSAASGPSSLESERSVKAVTPRGTATNVTQVAFLRQVTGDDGVALDLAAPWPAIDPETGTFSGNIPPGVGGSLELLAGVAEALPPGDIVVQVDSVGLGFVGGFGAPPPFYVTLHAGGAERRTITEPPQPSFLQSRDRPYALVDAFVPFDSSRARLLGVDFRDSTVRMLARFSGSVIPFAWTSVGVAVGIGRYGIYFGFDGSVMRYVAHSRWFAEGASEPPDPTIVAGPDAAHHAGALPGVTRIWSPAAYRAPATSVSPFLRSQHAAAATAWYPADFVLTWEAGGTLTVRDVTHRVTLPFTATGGSGWGFLTRANVLATGLDQLSFDTRVRDEVGTPAFDVIGYQHLYLTRPTCDGYWDVPEYCVALSATAELQPLDYDSDGQADGVGFVLLVNGEPFFMETSALPAAGTRWHLRAVTGRMTADCSQPVGPAMTDCRNYAFEPHPVRPDNVPGLRYVITVEAAYAVDPNAAADLSRVHTVPDPYYVTNALEAEVGGPLLRFVNLPARAVIRIYSLSGVLVQVLTHDDPAGGGELGWNLRTRNGRRIASGVYFYHVETPAGQQRVGRFTVVSGR